jgi:hypothetical protein
MATPDDIIEAKRIANARRMAETSMQSRSKSLADLESSVSKSKQEAIAAAAAAAEALKQAEADKAAAIQAQIDAARNAGMVAAQTGGTINAKTGLITPPSTSNKAATPKKIIGYIQWTNPFNGVSYNVPQYDDGSNDLVNWTGGIVVPQSFMIYTPPSSGGGGGGNTSQGSGNKTDSNAAYLAAQEQARIDAAAAAEAAKKEKAQNAISVLTERFNRYGLASLVPKIKELAIGGASEATITLQLQESEEYKTRFRANQDRIKKGLSVLEPGEYLGLEDDYRQILRAYGLRSFDNDNYVQQFISNDISTTELTNRVVTAVQRVQNADPAILTTLRGFYGISDNDLVAYVLDPTQQFQKIERQVAAAEIGAAAKLQGINAGVAVSEQLAAQGITKAQAQKGYATIADILPTAEKLSDIYAGTLDEYRLGQAEQEVFNTLASAQRKRQKLAEREVAAFGGSSGTGKSSLSTQLGGTF